MSIFNQKSKFKVKADIRAVRQAVEPTARPKPKQQQQLSAAGASGSRRRASPSGGGSGGGSTPRASPRPGSVAAARQRHRLQSASPLPPSGDEGGNSRKRRAVSSRSPASPNFSESGDDDEEDDWEESLDARKRSKRVHQPRADPNRSFAHPKLWAGGDENTERLPILHANDVASLEQKCQPALELAQEDVAIKLQYPGARYPERYELVWGKDKIEAVKDIVKVVNFVASIYLNDEDAKPFLDQSTGICRRLEKSRNTKDGAGFKAAVKEYNERLLGLQRKGVIAKNLGDLCGILRELIAFILDQIYDRTVAPNVELLSKYENGTDNVYGELLHPFISDILERAGLTSDKVFVDLGSGVGNVVLQAALETGAESWGCEMMENACNLADAQKQEFLARCRLWGLAHGSVHLERGDFRKSEKTLAALKRADVVLVNNQAFTAQLNDNLVNMFLDLKPGCKIISLKTFVHDNKNAENDVATSILDVEHLTYPEEYVSWTNASGTFCISTRKG
ncbi:histone-lysine N-methyltransferase, H3 lysine-79 specific [Lasiosphaeria ovina]|uniref:Histone-lysine N-methyltransferase, H3 lysine-79 specific n=1 Tax=Lasiosphaeria ovina TaxID=92902 RepID=A0AAE0TT29_9PEZI|nr:histone-lysine N-methyltransferase, H3 lysine-79 specific [Lasiosphaeria ovina]